MEKCYYSHYILWHYFQLTKSGYFQIIGKRKGQWKVIFKKKVSVEILNKEKLICGCSKNLGCQGHTDREK